ncbi:MAG: hypothetical protein KJ949_01250 [Nanoarchaeota archaeon]|nr:hypothetical protein [Nanoarchaeota archaeon]MBU4308229.1 hypothetical protein [Nanoarchaeota archaeon]
MHKKGDIPVTILVLGVVVICCLALLSFFTSTIQTRNSFVGINLLEKASAQIEENSFNGNEVEINLQEFKQSFFKKDVLVFSVKYVP